MDCIKVGSLIKFLRTERALTQKQLADMMNISDKTVSKWERGLGCPDVSLLPELSEALGVNIEGILSGSLSQNNVWEGNMKNSKYYVCPECGNISVCTGEAQVSCCGRKLEPTEAVKAENGERLLVEAVEDEWYVSGDHPMTKENYVSFAAFATGDKIQLYKFYPEWNLSFRIPKREHGKLMWYSADEGLKYMLI